MEFIAHIHQDEFRKVLFRIIMDFNLTVCAPVHFCCRPPDGLPYRSLISRILHRRWAILHTLVVGHSSQIESCSLSLFQFSGALTVSRHYPFDLNDSVLSPGGLTMVRQRMLSRPGGSKGGNVRTRSASAIAQPVLIAPQPSSQPPSPASSPVRNPILHNSSHSTHFQFHSRLNQPIITAKIAILLSKEEFVERPLARYEREHPQVAIRGATGPDSE